MFHRSSGGGSGAQGQIQNPATNIHSAVQQLKRMISAGQVTSETKRKALAVYKELRNVEEFLRTILTPTDVMMELQIFGGQVTNQGRLATILSSWRYT